MLEVMNLYFRHLHHKADMLKGISLQAQTGKITTILGPNGSGKTTLFRCIGGLWKPRQGEVRFDGQNLPALSYEKRARILASVPQEHTFPFPYSVLDVILMGRASHVGLFSSPTSSDRGRAEEVLKELAIAPLRDKSCTRISGGEKQLVLIARALVQEGPIMMLDEPTSHLDFRHQILILRKVRELARQRELVVLMTLHDPNLAMLFSDEVVLMNEGRIVSTGNPEAVITEQNLREVYRIDVHVTNLNGYRIVYPERNA